MPTTYTALVIVAFFVVPGYVGLFTFRFFVVLPRRDTPRLVIDALALSMLFWTVASPLVSWALDAKAFEEHPLGATALASLIALVAPLLLGVLIGWAIRSGKLGRTKFLPPKAWDSRFSEQEEMLVRVTLTDGSLIGGLWAGASCASAYPEEEDLYLECMFRLAADGSFVKAIPYSKGAWISGKSIRLLEFLGFEGGDDDGLEASDSERRRIQSDTDREPEHGPPSTWRDGGTAKTEPSTHAFSSTHVGSSDIEQR